MARSAIAKANGEYVGSDFSRYVKSLPYSDREIGEVLNLCPSAISKKRKNGNWTLREAAKIFKKGEATDDEILRLLRV